MLLNAPFVTEKFNQAMPYADFVASGESLGHRSQWDQRYEQLELTDHQRELVQSFIRPINVLSLSGTWCGDCALQGAAMQRVAEASDNITLRFLPKEEDHADLIVKCTINAGFRVPVTWFMAEDFEPVSRIGDRTLSRYRSMARKQLPEDACPVRAEPPADPVRTVLEEILDEYERVHLVLRTSARWREKYGD